MSGGDARADWEARIGRHTDVMAYRPPALEAPSGVQVRAGRGQVTVDWQQVEGSVGYLVQRSDDRDGEYQPVVSVNGGCGTARTSGSPTSTGRNSPSRSSERWTR
jgi:hypothetical protein